MIATQEAPPAVTQLDRFITRVETILRALRKLREKGVSVANVFVISDVPPRCWISLEDMKNAFSGERAELIEKADGSEWRLRFEGLLLVAQAEPSSPEVRSEVTL